MVSSVVKLSRRHAKLSTYSHTEGGITCPPIKSLLRAGTNRSKAIYLFPVLIRSKFFGWLKWEVGRCLAPINLSSHTGTALYTLRGAYVEKPGSGLMMYYSNTKYYSIGVPRADRLSKLFYSRRLISSRSFFPCERPKNAEAA